MKKEFKANKYGYSKSKWKKSYIKSKLKKPLGRGLAKRDRAERSELLVGTKYLRRNMGKQYGKLLPVNFEAVVLKCSNPNKQEMPFEHLTYKRL